MSQPSHYERSDVAVDYRRRFSKSFGRRLSNRLELRMLRKALARAGACERLLDVPCGAGRLLPTLVAHAPRVVGVDAARAMLDEARAARRSAASGGAAPQLLRASAFGLPFAPDTFDVTVCWRLLQHFDAPDDRRRLLLELRRVTRRAIVVSFSDAGTARARRLAGRPREKGGRVAIGREALAREIRDCGLVPDRFYRLFGPLSVVAAVVIFVT